MTATAIHSPTPWTWQYSTKSPAISIRGADNFPIVNVYLHSSLGLDGRSEADAHFILRACNSHDELLEACKRVLLQIEYRPAELGESDWPELANCLRAAIAKAERNQP